MPSGTSATKALKTQSIIKQIVIPNPPAGQDFLVTVPKGKRWKIIAFNWTINMVMNAQPRFLGYTIKPAGGSQMFFDGVAFNTSGGAQATLVQNGLSALSINNAAPALRYTMLPFGMPEQILGPGDQFGSGGNGSLIAADTITNIYLYVEEFTEI